jgi:hypothetical protein
VNRCELVTFSVFGFGLLSAFGDSAFGFGARAADSLAGRRRLGGKRDCGNVNSKVAPLARLRMNVEHSVRLLD